MLQKIVEIQKANARYDAEYDDYIVEEIQMEKVAKEIEALYKFRPLPAIAFPKYQIAREVLEEFFGSHKEPYAQPHDYPVWSFKKWLSQQEE